MSTKNDHKERAEIALHMAKRFYDAAGHGGVNGRGSAWKTGIHLDARIMSASSARVYAELAVHEAAHAKGKNEEGPTPLQVEASKIADNCTRLVEQLAYDIARGAFKTAELNPGFSELRNYINNTPATSGAEVKLK